MQSIYSNLFPTAEGDGVQASFEVISFSGWRYQEGQAKSKRRGSAQLSMAKLTEELENLEDGEKGKIVAGELEESEEKW